MFLRHLIGFWLLMVRFVILIDLKIKLLARFMPFTSYSSGCELWRNSKMTNEQLMRETTVRTEQFEHRTARKNFRIPSIR